MRSLSFPAIGTGNLNFPRDLVCRTLLREIHSFSSRRGSRHLGQVFIVVHPTDTETDAVSANLAKAVRSLSSACAGELDGILHVVLKVTLETRCEDKKHLSYLPSPVLPLGLFGVAHFTRRTLLKDSRLTLLSHRVGNLGLFTHTSWFQQHSTLCCYRGQDRTKEKKDATIESNMNYVVKISCTYIISHHFCQSFSRQFGAQSPLRDLQDRDDFGPADMQSFSRSQQSPGKKLQFLS